MAKDSTASGGITTGGLLLVLLIALKLTHHIEWDWLWVLFPLWMPIAIGMVIVAIALFWHVGLRR